MQNVDVLIRVKSIYFLPVIYFRVTGWGGGDWSISPLLLGGRRGTRWMGHQFVAGLTQRQLSFHTRIHTYGQMRIINLCEEVRAPTQILQTPHRKTPTTWSIRNQQILNVRQQCWWWCPLRAQIEVKYPKFSQSKVTRTESFQPSQIPKRELLKVNNDERLLTLNTFGY